MSIDKLRAVTLGKARHFEKTIVKIDGMSFEVRQPTIGQRGDIRNKMLEFNPDAEGDESSARFNMFEFLLHAVINLTFDPESGERVFTEEDIPTLKEQPAGGWFDDLTEAASKLCNIKSDETKKNSGETEESN